MSHRPERDGSAVPGAHVPYYLALEVVTHGWGRFVDEESGGTLDHRDMAIVHVHFDFPGRLRVGDVDIDVELISMGRSSLAFGLAMHQQEGPAAVGRTVVTHVDSARTTARPLTQVQRSSLERHLRPS